MGWTTCSWPHAAQATITRPPDHFPRMLPSSEGAVGRDRGMLAAPDSHDLGGRLVASTVWPLGIEWAVLHRLLLSSWSPSPCKRGGGLGHAPRRQQVLSGRTLTRRIVELARRSGGA